MYDLNSRKYIKSTCFTGNDEKLWMLDRSRCIYCYEKNTDTLFPVINLSNKYNYEYICNQLFLSDDLLFCLPMMGEKFYIISTKTGNILKEIITGRDYTYVASCFEYIGKVYVVYTASKTRIYKIDKNTLEIEVEEEWEYEWKKTCDLDVKDKNICAEAVLYGNSIVVGIWKSNKVLIYDLEKKKLDTLYEMNKKYQMYAAYLDTKENIWITNRNRPAVIYFNKFTNEENELNFDKLSTNNYIFKCIFFDSRILFLPIHGDLVPVYTIDREELSYIKLNNNGLTEEFDDKRYIFNGLVLKNEVLILLKKSLVSLKFEDCFLVTEKILEKTKNKGYMDVAREECAVIKNKLLFCKEEDVPLPIFLDILTHN